MRPGAMGPPKVYRAAAGGTGVLCGAESRHGEIAEALLGEGELGLHAGAGQLLGGLHPADGHPPALRIHP